MSDTTTDKPADTAKKAAPKIVAAEPDAKPHGPARVRVLERFMLLAEHAYNRRRVTMPVEHTLDDALHPEYLWPVNASLKRGDIVELTDETASFYGEVMIRHIDRDTQTVHTALIKDIRFPKAITLNMDFSSITIEQKGAAKWCVIRGTQVWKDGFETAQEAEFWVEKKRRQII